MGTIDYWCNAFTTERRPLWSSAIEEQDIPLKVRTADDDSFAEPSDMVERMDALGIDCLLLPTTEIPDEADALAYERYATQPTMLASLVKDYPGRFAGLVAIDPLRGIKGVREAAAALDVGGYVGLQLHTHSFDRAFDHADLYPFYALAADRDLPVVMQAGTSGGRMPSECGRPISIDRPALYFGSTPFVLSHTGWPWTEEAIAMAQKHANVFLGTAAYPPHHWSESLLRFMKGVGRGKTLFGTSFPVVGHRHALGRLDALGLDSEVREALLEGAARRVFKGL